MAQAVQITRTEMENVLRSDRGWTKVTPAKNVTLTKEDVYTWALTGTSVKVCVYSSIQASTGISRPVGGDAIRVCAVNFPNGDDEKGFGYIASKRVHRVVNWRDNLRARVDHVVGEAQKRWNETTAHKAKQKASQPAGDPAKYAPLFKLFATAGENLKYPKILLSVKGQPLQLSITGSGKYEGRMNLTDGKPFGENVWYGSIDPVTGKVFQSKSWKDEIGQILDLLTKDAANVAAAYGQKTGSCCFCRKSLTDARSVLVGYGATCAKNWGLFYPTMKAAQASAKAKLQEAS